MDRLTLEQIDRIELMVVDLHRQAFPEKHKPEEKKEETL